MVNFRYGIMKKSYKQCGCRFANPMGVLNRQRPAKESQAINPRFFIMNSRRTKLGHRTFQSEMVA